MTDLYSEWQNFYTEKVRSWMSLEELRAECGKLQTADSPSPEVLLVHAMHALEEVQAKIEALVEALETCLEIEGRSRVIEFARAALAAAKRSQRKKEVQDKA